MARLSPTVRTDVELLDAAVEHSDADASSARAVLHEALTRVQGRPFDASTGYEWAFRELHVAHAERVAVDAAHRLVTLALAAGEWREALWASEQGLLAVPATSRCIRTACEPFTLVAIRGVDAAMRDVLATVGGDGTEGQLQPDTIELYEELRVPPPASRSAQKRDASS